MRLSSPFLGSFTRQRISYTVVLLASIGIVPQLHGQVWQSAPALPSTGGFSGTIHQGNIVLAGTVSSLPSSSRVMYLAPGASAWATAPDFSDRRGAPIMGTDSLGRLIIAGGAGPLQFSSPTAIMTGFTYDLSSGTGGAIANRNHAVTGNGRAIDDQGRIYSIGGSFEGAVRNLVERYDGATNTWSILAPTPTNISSPGCVYDGNGGILAICGVPSLGASSTVYRYDIAQNTWSTRPSYPVAAAGVSAARGADGKIYAFGGLMPAGYLNSTYVMDPATGNWSPGPSLITARAGAIAVTDTAGFVYAIAGGNGAALASVERLYTGVASASDWHYLQ